MKIKISIIIPCFNEHGTIVQIIDKILEIKTFNFEIIVIDDFSSDRSREILKKLSEKKILNLILNEKNYGKGYSIRQGIKEATGDLILIQDADLEYDPKDYEKLFNPILNNKADVVFGSRFIGSEEKNVLYFYNYHVSRNFLPQMDCEVQEWFDRLWDNNHSICGVDVQLTKEFY